MARFCDDAGITLHIDVPYGTNAHHQIEAVFKAVGHALHGAVQPTRRCGTVYQGRIINKIREGNDL